MRVNDDARKSVVFFGVPTPEGVEYGGTGFMLCDFEDDILIPYIVTARHVAQTLENYRDTGFYIRANRKDGGDPLVPIEQADWAYHPDPTVDLAAANLSLSGNIFDIIYFPLRDRFFGNEDRVAKYGGPNDVLCGDPVSIIGLFRLHYGKQRNIPIVHTGHVAALPDPIERIPIEDAQGNTIEAEAYLVEAQTLDGLSGSPVFTKESVVLEHLGTHHGEHAHTYAALVLLGLYVGSWEGHPGEILASDKGLRSDKIRVPVGMGVVVPVQKIIEIVRGDPDLNRYRKARVDAVKAARLAATQGAVGQDAAFPAPPCYRCEAQSPPGLRLLICGIHEIEQFKAGRHLDFSVSLWIVVCLPTPGKSQPTDGLVSLEGAGRVTVALHSMFYNFAHVHQTLMITPAVAAVGTSRRREMTDLVEMLKAWKAAH